MRLPFYQLDISAVRIANIAVIVYDIPALPFPKDGDGVSIPCAGDHPGEGTGTGADIQPSALHIDLPSVGGLRGHERDAKIFGQREDDVLCDLGDVGADPIGILRVVVVGQFHQQANSIRTAGARVLVTSPRRVVVKALT